MGWVADAIISVLVLYGLGRILLPVFGDWTLLAAIVVATFLVSRRNALTRRAERRLSPHFAAEDRVSGPFFVRPAWPWKETSVRHPSATIDRPRLQ